MHRLFSAAVLLTLFAVVPLWAQTGAARPAQPAQPAPPTTPKDQQSYSIGISVGKDLQQTFKGEGLDVNLAMVLRGIADAINGKQVLTDAQIQVALQQLEEIAQAKQTQRGALTEQQAAKNKAEGDAFLAANAKKPGIKTTPSGLQYQVLKMGTGPRPKATNTVRTHYHGTLINGKVFDSSVQRNEPVEFPVSGVIPGWTEALQLMPVGSKWRLFIPSKLAYGERGAGDAIGPNATLIFDVELLNIVK